MVNRSIVFQKDTFYHIFNRGCDKQQLFFEARDYERFYNNIARFREFCPHIRIFAWCVLPNHFHLLLMESESDRWNSYPQDTNSKKAEQISLFMQKLQQAYAAFFNTKYGEKIKKAKGPVFEGRFKAKEVVNEAYLSHLKDYIEYNAVKHELVDKPEEWAYSSFHSVLDSYPFGDTNPIIPDDFDPYFE
jgi:REP element-mobilizing transposase RayT